MRVLHSQVDADISESFYGIFFFCGLVQDKKVLSGASHLLEETEGLVEVDWDCDLREVLPDRVLQDRPDADLHLRVFEEREFLSVREREWMRISSFYDLALLLLFKYRILKH